MGDYIKGDIVSDRKDHEGSWVCSFSITALNSRIKIIYEDLQNNQETIKL